LVGNQNHQPARSHRRNDVMRNAGELAQNGDNRTQRIMGNL
jgi:hypothetical protein